MPLEGTHHRALDDARNIARIACEIFKHNRANFPLESVV
jgi:inhibitor of KinA sporulation pathway (predicted exonuclease)